VLIYIALLHENSPAVLLICLNFEQNDDDDDDDPRTSTAYRSLTVVLPYCYRDTGQRISRRSCFEAFKNLRLVLSEVNSGMPEG